MHIRKSLSKREFSSSPRKTNPLGENLKGIEKNDIISDIFNNRSDFNEEKREVKIRLSQTSQVLSHELKEEIQNFLSQNKELAKLFEQLSLPEEVYTHREKHSDLILRKVGTYLQWLKIREENPSSDPLQKEEEVNNSEKLYLAIHKHNKGELIKNIFDNNEEKRKSIQAHRNKHVPNYYYLVYPETYAFN